jgi:hypothetical protein
MIKFHTFQNFFSVGDNLNKGKKIGVTDTKKSRDNIIVITIKANKGSTPLSREKISA